MIKAVQLGLGLLLVAGRSGAAEPGAPVDRAGPAESVVAAVDSAAVTGSTVYLPVAGYTPDTGVMFGGTALRFFYLDPAGPDQRPSVFSPALIYTLKSQLLVYLGVTLNWDRSRNSLQVVPKYVKFPDIYYGIGRDVDVDTDGEDFTSLRIGADLAYSRRVWREWRVGLGGWVYRHRLTEIEPGRQLDGGTVPGTADSWLTGLGPSLALDDRDNIWAPRQGLWLQARTRFARAALGSDYRCGEYTLDLRGYRGAGRDQVLAGQILVTRMTGEAPFFQLPRLGGDSGLRGYRGGLYRDQVCAFGRAEFRRSHLWGRLGVVLFAGIGDVAPAPDKLTLARHLWTVGGGLRYLLDEKQRVNVRIDLGLGNGDSGFFLSLGEAF